MADLLTHIEDWLDKVETYDSPTTNQESSVTDEQWSLLQVLLLEILYKDPDAYLYLFKRLAVKLQTVAAVVVSKVERLIALLPALSVEQGKYTQQELDGVLSALDNLLSLFNFYGENQRRANALDKTIKSVLKKHTMSLKQTEDGISRTEAYAEAKALLSEIATLLAQLTRRSNYLYALDADFIRDKWYEQSKKVLQRMSSVLQTALRKGDSETNISLGLLALRNRITAAVQTRDAFASKLTAMWTPIAPVIPAAMHSERGPSYAFISSSALLNADGVNYTLTVPLATSPSIKLAIPSVTKPYVAADTRQAHLDSSFSIGTTEVPLVRKAVYYRPCEPVDTPMIDIDPPRGEIYIANVIINMAPHTTFFNDVYAGDLLFLDITDHNVFFVGDVVLKDPTWEVWRIVNILSTSSAILTPINGATYGTDKRIVAVLVDDRLTVSVDGASKKVDLNTPPTWYGALADLMPWPTSTPNMYDVDWFQAGAPGNYGEQWSALTWDFPIDSLMTAYNQSFGSAVFSVTGTTTIQLHLTSLLPDSTGMVAIIDAADFANRDEQMPMQERLQLFARHVDKCKVRLEDPVGDFVPGETVTLSSGPVGEYFVYSYLPASLELTLEYLTALPVVGGDVTGGISGATGVITMSSLLTEDTGCTENRTLAIRRSDTTAGTISDVTFTIPSGTYSSGSDLAAAFSTLAPPLTVTYITSGDLLTLGTAQVGSKSWFRVLDGSANSALGLQVDTVEHGQDVTFDSLRARMETQAPILLSSTDLYPEKNILVEAVGTTTVKVLALDDLEDYVDGRISLRRKTALSYTSATGSFYVGDTITESTGLFSAKIEVIHTGAFELTNITGAIISGKTFTTSGGGSAVVVTPPGVEEAEASYTIESWDSGMWTLAVEQEIPSGLYAATVTRKRITLASQSTEPSSALQFASSSVVTELGFSTAPFYKQCYWFETTTDLSKLVSPPIRVGDFFVADPVTWVANSPPQLDFSTIEEIRDNTLRIATPEVCQSQSVRYIYAKGCRAAGSWTYVINEKLWQENSKRMELLLSQLNRLLEHVYINRQKAPQLTEAALGLYQLVAAISAPDPLPNDIDAVQSFFEELESRGLQNAKRYLELADLLGFFSLSAKQTTDIGQLETDLSAIGQSVPKLSEALIDDLLTEESSAKSSSNEQIEQQKSAPIIVAESDEEELWEY